MAGSVSGVERGGEWFVKLAGQEAWVKKIKRQRGEMSGMDGW
jgi:phage repressor protein C with HTH and peptisase S24 domain